MYITDIRGKPYEEGAKRLEENDKLPQRTKYEETVYVIKRNKQILVELRLDAENQMFVIKKTLKKPLKKPKAKKLQLIN